MNLDDTLTLEQLSVSFSTDDGILPAVHAVSLSLPPAGITCLVGESGCGKSLTARAILRLLPENAHISGRILFRGRDLRTMPPEEMRALRGRHIAMIFQEPMTSLNPVLKLTESCSRVRVSSRFMGGVFPGCWVGRACA